MKKATNFCDFLFIKQYDAQKHCNLTYFVQCLKEILYPATKMERNLFISPHVSACTELAVSKARFGEMVKKTRHLAPKANERHVRESKIDI